MLRPGCFNAPTHPPAPQPQHPNNALSFTALRWSVCMASGLLGRPLIRRCHACPGSEDSNATVPRDSDIDSPLIVSEGNKTTPNGLLLGNDFDSLAYSHRQNARNLVSLNMCTSLNHQLRMTSFRIKSTHLQVSFLSECECEEQGTRKCRHSRTCAVQKSLK